MKKKTKIKIEKTKKKPILLMIIGCFLIIILFFLYGPYKGLSDLWILSAMHTSERKYLAKMFYSTDYINKVLAENKVNSPKESTDANGNFLKPLDDEVTHLGENILNFTDILFSLVFN